MTPERWTRLAAHFEAALEVPPAERQAWLAGADLDPAMREEVGRMLAAHDQAQTFLEAPAEVACEDLLAEPSATEPAAAGTVGPYRLVREVSRGGMGVVYLAERADGQYEQAVAVKVLRRALDDGERHRRFLAERQILASLQHPHIARLLDGGVTADGQPYLVLPYVAGQAITDYCGAHALGLRPRLRLFAEVCDAVQYAHGRLVVHRDLKPSNILVTDKDGAPSVTLLDFGIAKLLDPEAEPAQTRTGLYLLTPEYASPEQVSGGPITTASDVYQLGLLLFELLTGHNAQRLESRALTEIARVVCTAEAPPPSRAAGAEGGVEPRQVGSELDAIVAKALRKAPERRYASAGALAEDVRRYLDGRRVLAHADSLGYRVRTVVRRNKALVGAAVAIALLLVGYAVTVTVQQARTARERDRAEQYAAFLADLFAAASPFDPQSLGPETTLRAFLDRGAERVRAELESAPALRASLLSTIGRAYVGLGQDSTARGLYDEALPALRARHGERSPAYVETLQRRAWVEADPATADSLHRRHLALARAVDGGTGAQTAEGLSVYGNFLTRQGRLEEAVGLLEEAVETAPEVETRIRALHFLAQTLGRMDRLAAADRALHEAYALHVQRYGPTHPGTAVVMTDLGAIAEGRGDLAAALRWKQDALAILEEKLGPDHPYTLAQLNNLGVLLGHLERLGEEEQIYRRVLAWREAHLGPAHRETAGALQNLAANLLRQDRLDEAEPLFREVLRRYAGSLPAQHYLHALPLLSLADLYLRRDDLRRAEATARTAAEQAAATLPPGHPLVGVALSRQGEAVARQGRYAEAERLLLRGYGALDRAEGYATYRATAAERVAALYEAWGRPEEAARYR